MESTYVSVHCIRRQRREDDRGDGEGQEGWAVLDGVVSLSFIRKLRFQQSRR